MATDIDEASAAFAETVGGSAQSCGCRVTGFVDERGGHRRRLECAYEQAGGQFITSATLKDSDDLVTVARELGVIVTQDADNGR